MVLNALVSVIGKRNANSLRNLVIGAGLIGSHHLSRSSLYFTPGKKNSELVKPKPGLLDVLSDKDKQSLRDAQSVSKFTISEEKKVPSTAISRAAILGSTGISIFSSYVFNSVKTKIVGKSEGDGDFVLSPQDADKLASTLCRMRGAALKLGQTLSIQEDKLIPEVVREAFDKARSFANKMPKSQLDSVMTQSLGENWELKFESFEDDPFAAASIGQVHKARLIDGTEVAVKVQYPGVADSIDSDLDSLKTLISYFNLLPKSFYLDQFIRNTRAELKEECNYEIEADKQMTYKWLINEFGLGNKYIIPSIIPETSSKQIMVSEYKPGLSIDDIAAMPSQAIRNYVGHLVMENTIEELFLMNYMQTDPNLSNYFFDNEQMKLILLDFGAARRYDKKFCDTYMGIIQSAANRDRENCFKYSKELGFLTGEENSKMIEAHFMSLFAVAEPFGFDGKYDFGSQRITELVYEYMPSMMKNRLCPPPQEVYSLHRKLSGAYLINIKLRSQVNVKRIMEEVVQKCKNKDIK